MDSTLAAYNLVAKNLTRSQALTAKDPTVKQATDYFKANIGKVNSIDDFVNNPRLFNYAMTAFGLGDMTYAKGLIKQVLKQGVTSTTALANKLSNQNIKALATAFDFKTLGSTVTHTSTFQTTVVNKYLEQSLENTQGQQNTAVQLALYFSQNAPNIKDAYGILADKNLLTVAQTALGISSSSSQQNIAVQFATLSKKINVADFKDPTKLQAFIARFCAQADLNGQNTGSATNTSTAASLISVVSSATDQPSFSTDLLMSMQKIRLGG